MTREQLKQRFPRSSASFIERNCDRTERLHSGDEKRLEGDALECPVSRKETGRARVTIRFVIHAVRPADWDGWHVKELQDCLVHAGLLDGDDWDLLEGHVVSEKARTRDEERTEVTIYDTFRIPAEDR